MWLRIEATDVAVERDSKAPGRESDNEEYDIEKENLGITRNRTKP